MWKSTLTQLTQADREKITMFRDDGMTMTAIAKRFGVSIPTISRLLDEKRSQRSAAASAGARAEAKSEAI